MEDKEYLEETKDRDEGGKAVSEEAGKTPVSMRRSVTSAADRRVRPVPWLPWAG